MRLSSWFFLLSLLLCSSIFMTSCNGVAARAEARSQQALKQTEELTQRVGTVEGDLTTTQSTVSTMQTSIRTDMETFKDGVSQRIGKVEGDISTKNTSIVNSPWMIIGVVGIVVVALVLLIYFVLRLFVVVPKERAIGALKGAINRAIRSDENNLDESQFKKFLEQARSVRDESEV